MRALIAASVLGTLVIIGSSAGCSSDGADATTTSGAVDGGLPEAAPCNPATTSDDPYNCGACGVVCRYASAEGVCASGSCSMGKCQPGFVDADKSAANGCEYACWPTNGGVEICDGVDNDCNGKVDEGFDLQTDANHCGSCDVACLSGAGTACVAGKCAVGTCPDGYRDLDKSPTNGCEHKCAVWPTKSETCNGVDDDCNGTVDDQAQSVGDACDTSCPAVDPCVASGTCTAKTSTCVGKCCGICTAGTTVCSSNDLSCIGGTHPQAEVCNGADDDCDGLIDEGFDLQIDPNNCGSCGGKCDLPGAIAGCGVGKCKVVSCKPGFANVDGIDDNGCEYGCPVNPPSAETCNGLDDDCNGIVDDAASIAPQKPSSAGCNPAPDTPCAGADFVCQGKAGWRCDYGVGVEVDADGNLAFSESKCDGIDGNCNGDVDEPFAVGMVCDNGLLGACRDVGARACDPNDTSRTVCDLSVLPDAVPGAPRTETCNGIDDDCDGTIDNGIVDDMATIQIGATSFKIDRYEASHPDATKSTAGTNTARRCVNANVLPWTSVTKAAAEAACAATGARLCTATELQSACASSAGNAYPYGTSYQPLTCNGLDYDGDATAAGNNDVLLPTGSLTSCATASGVYDLSGNAAEWSTTVTGNTGAPQNLVIYRATGGSYETPASGLTCQFAANLYPSNAMLPALGFRCCKD